MLEQQWCKRRRNETRSKITYKYPEVWFLVGGNDQAIDTGC